MEQQVVERWNSPRADVLSGKDGVTVYVDLPGALETDVEISVERDVLTITANPTTRFEDSIPLRHEEFRLTPLRRRIALSEGLDTEHIAAEMRDGVLRVTIPHRRAPEPRKITVNAA